MSILSFPSGIIPSAIDWSIKSNTQSMTSSLSGVIQTVALPGDKWTAKLTFTNRTGEQARKIRAFLASLRGMAGRFYLTPYDHSRPSGDGTGLPKVAGVGQSGSTLAIDGCAPAVTGWLLTGDYFQIGNELKMVTADCDTDYLGSTTLHFAPPLRSSPSDSAALVVVEPKAVMMLIDDNQAQWSAQPWTGSEKLYAFSFSCQEALDI